MGRKLKGKRLQEMLDKHWMTILDKDEKGMPLPPAPTSEEFRVAVAAHNAQYEPERRGTPSLWNGGGYSLGTGLGTHQFDAERWRQEMHGRAGSSIMYTAGKPTTSTDWTCDAEDLKSCPVVGEPIVEVPRWMYEEWACLAGEVDTEWITYLVGSLHGKGAVIESFYFPPQLASGAHVAQPDEAFRPQPGTIGATHSHVRMGAFWSKTDEDHANWPVEIVINARAESKCRVRLQLECQRFARIDAKIKLTGTWQRPSEWREALNRALEDGERARKEAEAKRAAEAPAPASASPISTQANSGVTQEWVGKHWDQAKQQWVDNVATNSNDSVSEEVLQHFRQHGWGHL